MELFQNKKSSKEAEKIQPLAARMRPRTLDEIIGQSEILGKGKLLRRAIESDTITSIILYGPPGCGKTSIANVIASITKHHFEETSGVIANVAVLREILSKAANLKKHSNRKTILFVDEIHHFNKSQQDILLPYVEDGTIILIGATTHNPFFFINSPLISRSRVFELKTLTTEDMMAIMKLAICDERGLKHLPIEIDDDALMHFAKFSEGDARKALNALELAALTTPPDENGKIHITLQVAEDSIQKKAVVYDHDEDGHYDTISAFIKSVRGSDPDAAIYWLAKMLYAGEDPRFIARRLIILAAEDIGNADPRGLLVAVAAKEAVEFVGMPEARIILAQTTTYLACAPKSNAAYMAIEKAMDDVEKSKTLDVPDHLKSSNYKGAKELGHTGYIYPHDFEGHFKAQTYFPSEKIYYEPSGEGYEETLKMRLANWRKKSRKQKGADNET